MDDLRESQRVPLRCTQCMQRRVKCNKKIPCDTCTANSRAHLCMREIVRVRGKPAMAALPVEDDDANFVRENSKLRERVTELELALLMSSRGRAGQPSAAPSTGKAETLKPGHIATYEEVGAILDEWDLGVSKNRPLQGGDSGKDMGYFVELLSLLPSRPNSTVVVQFSLQMLGWIHCALRVDHFLAEHEAFQDALEAGTLQVLENYGWMATYFSVLTVGLFFMSDQETRSLSLSIDTGDSNPLAICHRWYRSASRQLEYADVMGKPRLHVVQVAAILTLCNSHFGESYRGFSLLSLAINTARALKMHCLGTESSYPQSLNRFEEWSTRQGRELGRRLWWTLVICDWLGGLRRPTILAQDSFDCTLVSGQFDYNVTLGGRPVSDGTIVVTPLLHHMELAKLARQVHEFAQIRKTSLAALCQFLRQLNELEKSFISKLGRFFAGSPEGIDEAESEPIWLSGQRSHYLCSVHFVRLTVCRVLLEPRLSKLPEAWSEIRTQAMTAASKVVDMQTVNSVYQMMWLFDSATVAAGAFLCLDLLTAGRDRPPSEVEEQRFLVERCIASLRLHEHKTAICREGPRALRCLLDLQSRQQLEPMTQEEIIQAILTLGRHSEQDLSTTMQEEQAQGDQPSWLFPSGIEFGSGGSGYLPPASISAVLPGLLNQYEPLYFDWESDEAMSNMTGENFQGMEEGLLY